ncbi:MULTISPECIES: ferredoxin [unclassified Streptomyces]|uniref:ferredoxin n=1 Tax=unclassified Streptomyces TaxID=2593676 RepID=UPI0016614CAF|nr:MULTISPECIES: ferredoxin [unclassified Streptomyces]MBD0711638.1 cytochrome [Streptomyces sp. CBMA291]MBD0713389.1 cytochrome [Streptomyces sp. CBMA370]
MSAVSWNARVDSGLCMGSGMCAAIAPEVFAVDGEHARPLTEAVAPDDRVLEAADVCPAQAITVHDGTSVLAPRP